MLNNKWPTENELRVSLEVLYLLTSRLFFIFYFKLITFHFILFIHVFSIFTLQVLCVCTYGFQFSAFMGFLSVRMSGSQFFMSSLGLLSVCLFCLNSFCFILFYYYLIETSYYLMLNVSSK